MWSIFINNYYKILFIIKSEIYENTEIPVLKFQADGVLI